MKTPSTFKVYNASAGSGKTFTLVKEYLKILLLNDDIYTFQKILAITFTNKAAAEMKERVLHNLDVFANNGSTPILEEIIKETALDVRTIRSRSAKIYDAVLQNYSAFAITTIDSFTYKVIRSFAYDLNLPLNFEVELDPSDILSEAVDVLISKIGTHKALTKLLVKYTQDKVDEDKSWDIARDLNEIAKVLLNENDIPHFKKLANKSISDFSTLRKKIHATSTEIENKCSALGNEVKNILDANGLTNKDFLFGDYPKHFVKFQNFKNSYAAIKFDGRLDKNIQAHKFYSASAASAAKAQIDTLSDDLLGYYQKSSDLYDRYLGEYLICRSIAKSITPLAVLNHINKELVHIKEDNNIQLNAEFNQLIHEEIKEQPAPFIYERIGQRYQYYFIDEMQDTSVLQWNNLIPLIANALAQENSLLFLVGDAKQAIYRWRGGKAEQFIALSSEASHPFPVQKELKNLGVNFRSCSEVINFNNQFFTYLSRYFQNESYQKLYELGNQQKIHDKYGGYVHLTFFEDQNKEQNIKIYNEEVYQKVWQLKDAYDLGEICIIVRKKDEGVHLAKYLTEKDIPVMSSDSLLLNNDKKVQFVVHVLQLFYQPNDKEILYECLCFIHDYFELTVDKHEFIHQHIHQPIDTVFRSFRQFTESLHYEDAKQWSLYDLSEAIIRGFQLIKTSDAYLQFFLDIVLEQHRKGSALEDFLRFWDAKKEGLSIAAQEHSEAVQIMTIHKSKGLEFPVVIFPTDIDIYGQINPKIWLDKVPKDFGFDRFYINYSKTQTHLINERALQIHEEIQQSLELDSFNLLYVAFTRAIEQLHIVSKFKNQKDGISQNYSSGILIQFLKDAQLWDENRLTYDFGDQERSSSKPKSKVKTTHQRQFISNHWKNANLVLVASDSKLWDTKQGEAIDFGNLLHNIMENIYTFEDIVPVLNAIKNKGVVNDAQYEYLKEKINEIVHHPALNSYFSKIEGNIFNERAFTAQNETIIPDRLVVNENREAIIIDYKTGIPKDSHRKQVQHYAQILAQSKIKVTKKLLVYVNDKIALIEVS